MIIVHNLNKLRWLCPNQIFISNVFKPEDAYALNGMYDFLKENEVSFAVK